MIDQYHQSTFSGALPFIDTKQEVGNYENIINPTVKENNLEGASCNHDELSSLGEWAIEYIKDCSQCDCKPSAKEVDVTLQFTTEDAGSVLSTNKFGDYESVFHQDPNQCGWIQSDYFLNDGISQPFSKKIGIVDISNDEIKKIWDEAG